MQTLIWPLSLLILALLLIFLEIFVPSGGILAVMASAAVVASVAVAFSVSVWAGTMILLIDIVVVPLAIVGAIRWWPHTPLGKLMLIRRPESEDEVLPDTEEYRLRDTMVGKRGLAKTALLPSGDITIDQRVYDAVSDGMAIEAGTPIVVVAVRTQRIVVRPLSEKERAEQDEGTDDILSTPIDSLGIESMDDPMA